MLTPDHRGRLRDAASRLADAGGTAVVIAPSPDLRYLIGYEPMPLERPTVLVVTVDGAPALIVPALELPLAQQAPAADAVELVGWRDDEDPYATIASRIAGGGTVFVGERIWGSHVLALQRALPGAAWASATPIVGAMRARKDPAELDALRRAASAADAAFGDLVSEPFSGRTERAIAATLADVLVERGHDSAAFTIVASGPNAASPHHEPTDRTIGAGDAVVLDFGGTVDGYYSDTTRTVAVGGPGERLRAVHAVVAEAQRVATEAVRPGVEIEAVDRAARTVIGDAGFGERFIHRTGHGVGMELHEPPYATAGDRTVLEPGMTFSVEPGIYLDGELGVRIEDIVTVTDDGVEPLNTTSRDLLTVD
ncbi:MAG TPA: Xaa-Pro peptidase family protein [Actinomycetota bacterium]|nr:Xaa-Pro peptidase family protein [Actinomycetota bacterium]